MNEYREYRDPHCQRCDVPLDSGVVETQHGETYCGLCAADLEIEDDEDDDEAEEGD